MKQKDKEYISIIGHEFRTPLSSIRWYLSMILEGDMGEISLEARKALNHCYDSTTRLTRLTNDILTLSKIEAGKMEYYPEELDIVEFLKSVYNDTFIEVENKRLEFEIQIDSQIKGEKIFLDKDKLKQVFINLIGNAVKFTDSGGKIIIKATKKENSIIFEVIDNGIGIPEENIKTLFKKYSQVHWKLQRGNKHWLGLGLTLCKKFIKDFWSEITIQSTVWNWSTFSFIIDINK